MSNKPLKVQDGIEFSDGTVLTSSGLVDDLRCWIRTFGNSNSDVRFSLSTKFDNNGDVVFLAMEVQGAGATGFPVMSKMDDRGNLIWQKDLNNELSGIYVPYGLAIDNENNIFISISILSETSIGQAFIVKFDPDGVIVWQKEIQIEGELQKICIVALETTHENDVIGCGSQTYDRTENSYTNRLASKSTSAGTLKIDKATNTAIRTLVESNRWSLMTLVGTGASEHPLVTVLSAYTDSSDIILVYNAADGMAITADEPFTVETITYDIDFAILKCDGATGDLVWHSSFGRGNVDEGSLGMSLTRQEIDGTTRDIFTVTGTISEDSVVSGFPRMNIYSFESDGNPLQTVNNPYSNLLMEVAANTGTIYDSAYDSFGNLYAIGTIVEGSLSNKSGLFLMKMTSAGILEWSKAFLNTSDYDTRGCSIVATEDVVYALAVDIPREDGYISVSILSFSTSSGNLIDSSTVQKVNTGTFDLSNFLDTYRHGSLIDYKDGYINYCMSTGEGSFVKFAVGSINASLPELHIVDWLLDSKYTYTNSDLTLDLIWQNFNEVDDLVVQEGSVAQGITNFASEASNTFSVLLNTRTAIAYTGDITFNATSIIGSGSAGSTGQGTIELVPDIDLYYISGSGYGSQGGQYLIIDPTTPNHIHIRAGGDIDEAATQLILGGEKANVTVRDQNDSYVEKHYVTINTHDNTTNEYAWTFDNNANLVLPAGGDILDSTGTTVIGSGAVKLTAPNNRRIEEVHGYNSVSVTEIVITDLDTVASRTQTGNFIYIDSTTTTIDDIISTPANYDNAYEFEFSLDNTTWYAWTGSTDPDGDERGYGISQSVTYLEGETVYFRYKTGGNPVVWWDKAELPGGDTNFRGAVIDYHAWTGQSTIIGTIHIVDDDGEGHITHTEVQSGSSDGENDDLWLVQNEGTISYRRIDGESKTLKIQWTAKVFYGSELYDD